MRKEFENMVNDLIKTTLLHNDDLRQYTMLDRKIGMSDRDKEIVRKCIDGKSFANLAKEYDVSFNRVRKIVMKFMKHVKSVEEGKGTYEY